MDDAEYLRWLGKGNRHMGKPRGLVPQGKALSNIADRIDKTNAQLEQRTVEVEALKDALRTSQDMVPTNWCDPMLSGPDKLLTVPADCPGIERLLSGIQGKLAAHADHAIESLPTKDTSGAEPGHVPGQKLPDDCAVNLADLPHGWKVAAIGDGMPLAAPDRVLDRIFEALAWDTDEIEPDPTERRKCKDIADRWNLPPSERLPDKDSSDE